MHQLTDTCDCIKDQCDPTESGASVYVGLEHIDPGSFVLARHGRPSDVHSAKTVFRKGDILYGKLRPYLDKAVMAPCDGICSTDILVIRPKPDLCGAYLLSLIHSNAFRTHADQTTNGVNHPRTSWPDLSIFSWDVPPKPEQERIAAILWKVQRAIETEEKLVTNARELKQSAMRQLFTHGLRNEKQKNTDIGPIPQSWALHHLEDCCDVLSSSLSYTDFVEMPEDNKAECIVAMGIKVSDMNLPGNEICIIKANIEKRVPRSLAERKFVPPDTVVFPKRGAAIATNKKRLTTAWTVLDPNIIGVRAGNTVDSGFIFQWFQQFDLRAITEAGPTPQLNKKNLTPLLLPIPEGLTEQREIAAILQTIDRKIALHERKRAALSDLFQTLLHQLMTAQIRVHNFDIDTSEVTV